MAAIPTRKIGRFELVRELGRGAQGAVWLATDTRLGRQVALKTLQLAPGEDEDGELVKTLLDEARIVSQLSHPNLVPLHDAGEEGGSPYLVFEFVEGRTLAALLKEKGKLSVGQAVDVASALAQGVACAHARGVVHRDLKPANVMLAGDGVPRLMDFGIAQRAAHAAAPDQVLSGTPSYMAPEYIESQRFLPASDVFALGVILYEMLTGAPPVRGADPLQTIERIVREPFRPPSDKAPEVDERLDALVMKALAKNPAERYADAAQLAAALAHYLKLGEPAPADGAAATVEFLMRRIRHKSDFPALSSTISAINRTVASDREPVGRLCSAILKDFALTNRLLKLVNAAHYGQYGGSISTVSRAISILGFDAVRNVALTLMLFEHLHNRANAVALKDEVVSTYFSGLLALELARPLGIRDAEQAFICAMFHRLGKLLVTFYLHEEAQAIARLVESRTHDPDRAALEVLGVSYEELGMGVGKAWNLPETIVKSMRAVKDAPRERPAQELERLRLLSGLANELADTVKSASEKERPARLASLTAKYGRACGTSEQALAAAVRASTAGITREGQALGIPAGASPFVTSAKQWGAPEPAPAGNAADAIDAPTVRLEAAEAPTQVLGAPGARAPARHAALAAGVQDITNTLIGDFDLNDVMRIILETMYRAMGFKRVLLFVLDPARRALRCRMCFGEDADAVSRKDLSLPLAGARDVFAAATAQGADVLIEDLQAEKIRPYVPEWYRRELGARAMVLLPIVNRKSTVGLFYGDADAPDTMRFSAEELNLLKTLRNQAVLAIRQKA